MIPTVSSLDKPAVAMVEKPLIFSGPMVRAILAGTKSQTRRIAKAVARPEIPTLGREWHRVCDLWAKCPYGIPGQTRLWVREACATFDTGAVLYRADGEPKYHGKWRPSIHMPRWASRINLLLTGVRVERLRDISEQDAMDEGYYQAVQEETTGGLDPVDWYRELWESLHGPGSWADSPWVWVLTFRRETQ